MIPIVFSIYDKKFRTSEDFERFNQAQIVAIGYSLLTNCKLLKSDDGEEVQHIRALHTNGHDWALYEIHDNFVKKTNFFKPKVHNRDADYYPRFYDNYNHMQAVLGLIRYALSIIIN